ncbi:MAG: serine hydrolase domain-containing protein [Actinomycetota bacterium]
MTMAVHTLKKMARLEAITLLLVLVTFIFALWFSVGMMGFNREPRDGAGFSPEVERRLEETLTRVMGEGEIPGAVVGIWIPGQGTWVKARGVSDIATGAPMDLSDRVRIGSMTKTYVATVVLQLVGEGKMSLEDPLGVFIPWFPGGQGITIRQLLNHTSGLFDFVSDQEFDELVTSDPLRKWKPEELVAYATANPPYFEPGAGWRYSNTNYVLLGMVVEALTGRPLAAEVTDRVINPLGLNATRYPDGPSIEGPHSAGYNELDGALVDWTNLDPSAGAGSAAMISNLWDLKTWTEALAHGRLVEPGLQAERLQWEITTDTTGQRTYGLGLLNFAGFVGHDGNAFGYSVSAYYHPPTRATIVVIFNKVPGIEMNANIAFARFAGIVLPGMSPYVE